MSRTMALRTAYLALAALLLPGISQAGCSGSDMGYTKTTYPIVLAHGAFLDAQLGSLPYWYETTEALSECDGADVYVTEVSKIHEVEVRGEQLLAQVEEIAAVHGGKVNLIGHSMGGLDARYVMSVRPDLVASVTTVGTPNHGAGSFSGIDYEPSGLLGRLFDLFGSATDRVIQFVTTSDNPNDISAGLEALSIEGVARFNASYPAGIPDEWCGETAATVNVGGYDIAVYSWSGDNPSPWQERSYNYPAKTLDRAVVPAFEVMDSRSDEPTDGLVGVCSSHFGKVLRDNYNWNHFDEVNQVEGITARFESNPVSVFRQHANRLRNRGL